MQICRFQMEVVKVLSFFVNLKYVWYFGIDTLTYDNVDF